MSVIQGIVDMVNASNYSFQLDIRGEYQTSSEKKILSKLAQRRMVDGVLILSH